MSICRSGFFQLFRYQLGMSLVYLTKSNGIYILADANRKGICAITGHIICVKYLNILIIGTIIQNDS